MKKILFILLALVIPATAANHAVVPTGFCTNNGDGTNWNCAASPGAAGAFVGIPSTKVRGDIYYLADGNYGNSLSITTADSGTSTIELRKAQSFDHGPATGWNTGTMGSGQAAIRSTGSGTLVNTSTDYWIINGNGGGASTEIGCGGVNANPPSTMKGAAPTPSACGIIIDDSTCTSTATDGCDSGNGVIHGGGHDILWESVEWFGQGLNSNGNNNSETYFWFSNGTGTNNTITHSYLHNASTTYLTVVSGGWNNGSFDHNYVWGLFDGTINHGEAIQLQGTNSGDVIHHNIFRDQQTNGDFVSVTAGAAGTENNMAFYDNVDFCSAGGTGTTCRHNDGVIGCFNSQTCTNYLVYDNTFSFPNTSGSGCGYNITGGPGTMIWKNNILFGCNGFGRSGGTVTIDYNSYLNSGQAAIGAHDVSNGSAANPFVSSTNYNLTVDGSDYNSRVSLGSPYDTDINAVAFTTDRGAYQFVSSTQATDPSCSPGTGTYTTTQTVTCTNLNSGTTDMCYTTNGTTPATDGTGTGCTTGTLYTTTISVASSETLKIIAGTSTLTDSNVISYVYTIAPLVSTPTFSPVAGTYIGTQSVTISSSTGGATLCYTIDGTTPTANGAGTCTHGTTYSTAVPVTSSQTLKAIGSESGDTDSNVGTAAYIITYPSVYVAISPLMIAGSASTGWIISCPTCVTTAVTSFNGRKGAVTLTKGDVTGTGIAATTTATTTLH